MNDSIHDEVDFPEGDSTLRTGLSIDPGVLKVYTTGPVTVVGFGGNDVPDEVCIAAYRDQLMRLVEEHQCQTLAFDLTGVKLIPSGMLGVLVTLSKRVGHVELYNASADIRNVLQLTNLLSMFDLKELPL